MDMAKKTAGESDPPGRTPRAAGKEAQKPGGPKQAKAGGDLYPRMTDDERVVDFEHPTREARAGHRNIKNYFESERDEHIESFVQLGAGRIRRELDEFGVLVSDKAKAMNRAVKKHAEVGDKDRIVWHGTQSDGTDLEKLKVGQVIEINSPVSTSTSLGVSAEFAKGQTMLRVHLPGEVRRLVTNPAELEMTIPDGYQFRVVRVYRGAKDVTVGGTTWTIKQWADVVVEKVPK